MKKIIYVFCLASVLGALFFSAHSNLWKEHLIYDVWTFHSRYLEFAKTWSFANFSSNEYLPMSLFFFLLPGVFGPDLTQEEYSNIFILINLVLILVHVYLYKLTSKSVNFYLVLSLFLAFGPILLFRFELLASLLVLISIYFFTKEKYVLSGGFIGLSIATKIYPLFVFPYFLFLLIKNKTLKKSFEYVLGSILGILIPFVIYFALQGNFLDPLKNISFHTQKPIGVESIAASAISIRSLFTTESLPEIILEHGIWGIPYSSSLVDYLPYFAVVLTYFYIFFRTKRGIDFKVASIILILMVFLLTSKYLNPQYLFWPISLIPLIRFRLSGIYYLLVLNTFTLLFFTQLVYPIYYSQFLSVFGQGYANRTFFVLQLRNFLIFVEIFILVNIVHKIEE